MMFSFVEFFREWLAPWEIASGDSRVYLTARTALASLTAFLIAVLLGPLAIRFLKRRFPERIASDSPTLNKLHASKNQTPTMGGLFVVGAVLISTFLWGDLANRYTQLGLFAGLAFSILGATDDWIKLSTSRNGLKARTKFLCQWGIALVIGLVLYDQQREIASGIDLVWPIGGASVGLGIAFIAWSGLVIVSTSNAVNLTDGLDGLASGCMIFSGSAFVALAYLAGHSVLSRYVSVPCIPGCGELCVVLGSTVGALLGFLWFNCHPAQVFMGDTGSLPLGALLGLAALATRQEFLLLVCGGVFVVETVSVILQVGWFRMTGRRLIACSPLHNHYVFRGDPETRIVVRFWISSALLAIVSVASLKIR